MIHIVARRMTSISGSVHGPSGSDPMSRNMLVTVDSSPARADRIAATRTELGNAEKLSGQPRQQALKKLASQLDKDAGRATDKAKAKMLTDAVNELATQR